MSRYYFNFNNIDLTDMVGVRTVEIGGLPSRAVSSIDVWDMIGSVFDSVKNGDREISVTFFILVDRKKLRQDPRILDGVISDVKNALYTDYPAPLFLGREDRYIYAIAEGDLEIEDLGEGVSECKVDFLCNDPLWYDVNVHSFNFDGKEGTVINNGNVPTTPVINVGICGNTTFVQLEKKNTKERILIGELPRTQKPTVPANSTILFDNCQSTSGWVQSQAGLDNGCSSGGTLAVTNDGGGLCLGSPSGSGTWKGASYRKNLSAPIKDFKVTVNFSFNSTGINGDPSRVEYKDYGGDNIGSVGGGSVSYTYKVATKSSNLNVRTGPGTNYTRIGSYPKGHEISGGTVVNGWLQHDYNGRTAYCCMQYIETIAHDNRWSSTVCNFVTNRSTALRAAADEWSNAYTTIPSGEVVRCYINEVGENTKFRQLQVPYKGCGGYIKSSDLTRASEMEPIKIEYTLQGETADDKEGIIQLYGYSSTGVQLFSLSLIDDSEWYEATYPLIKTNGRDFLYEQKYIEPAPKQKAVESSNTVKYENILSGQLGNWNEFYGDLYIERVNNVWYAFVNKYGGKFIQSGRVYDTSNESQNLSYIVMYVGVANNDKMSAMSINEIKIQTANEIKPAEQNIQRFEDGDVLEIDCGIPSVKLNGVERNDLVDIGSQFFDLEVGENQIKVASDANINFGATFNEKFL